MKVITLRRLRNLAFAILVIIGLASSQTKAASTDAIITFCQGYDDCDPEFCSWAFITCYSLGGWEWQGCYEDADPECGCAYQCYVPY